MAGPGYSGYFLSGLASGIQSMLPQIQASKQKKKQKEEANKLMKQLAEAVNVFVSNNQDELDSIAPPPSEFGASSETPSTVTPDLQYPGKDYSFSSMMGNLPKIGSQGVLADPRMLPLLVTANAVRDSLATAFKDIFIQIDRGNVKKYEEDIEYIKNMIDRITEINIAGGDANSHYGFEDLVTEESKKWFRVEKTFGQTPASKVTPGMVGDISALTGGFSQETIKGIRTQPATETPTLADEKTAISLLRTFLNATPEQYDANRTRIEQRTGLDLSVYTQDILKEEGSEFYNLYDTPEEVLTKVKAPEGSGLMVVPSRDSKTGKYYASFQKKATTPTPGGGRATSLPLQEDYKQKALDANTWEDAEEVIDTYIKAGYDSAEMPTEQEWITGKIDELDNHVEMLKEITDENGKLQGDKSFKFMSGDEEKNQTGEAWYKDIYEAYMFYLEELKKMGVDVSRFPKIRSLEEYNKSDTKQGKGLFYPSTWGKQKSIYY